MSVRVQIEFPNNIYFMSDFYTLQTVVSLNYFGLNEEVEQMSGNNYYYRLQVLMIIASGQLNQFQIFGI